MGKIGRKILASMLLCIALSPMSALAQEPTNTEGAIRNDTVNPSTTFLPEITNDRIRGNYDCTIVLKIFEDKYFFELDNSFGERGGIARFNQAVNALNEDSRNVWGVISPNDILGCTIVTGRIKLAYLSLYIFYVIKVLAVLSGTVSMISIIFGGYKYIISAITENKDEGKKTIIYAIAGLIVSTLAWIVVNIVQTFLTG